MADFVDAGDDFAVDRSVYQAPDLQASLLASSQETYGNPNTTQYDSLLVRYVRDIVGSSPVLQSAVTDPGVNPGGLDGPLGDSRSASNEMMNSSIKDEPGSIQKMMASFAKAIGYDMSDPADRKAVAPIISGTLGAMLMGVSGGISAAQARKMKEQELEQLKPLQMAQTDYYSAKAADERRRSANQDFSKVGFTGIINQPFKPAPIAPLYQPRQPR